MATVRDILAKAGANLDESMGVRAVAESRPSLAPVPDPRDGKPIEPGVYFRMELGGITGHGDFTKSTGVYLAPGECIKAAAAVLRVFIDNGDRTNRQKARLKYLLDKWGHEKFVAETIEPSLGEPYHTRTPPRGGQNQRRASLMAARLRKS